MIFWLAYLSVAAAVSAELEHCDWNVREHIPLSKIVVQSHRGAGTLMPENSVEAFELAWRLGTIPEADLRTSQDNVIVAFHDRDFKRILPDASPEKQESGVENYTWRELSQIDIGAWKDEQFRDQRIPRMSDIYEILKRNPERRLYIDIKNVDLAQLAKESRDVHKQLILASTDYAIIRKWKKLAPSSVTLHWMGGKEEALRSRLQKLEAEQFADVTQLQIHVRVDDAGEFSPSRSFLLETGDRLRKHGVLFQVLPWEIKEPEVFWRLMDLGVASFATDFPDVTMRAIRDYYSMDDR